MSFWQRVKQMGRSFMAGRHGADSLSHTLMWAGLVLYILGTAFNTGVLLFLGFAVYCITIFRVFSRNNEKRSTENRRFITWKTRVTTKGKQARMRFQNRKKYKYFKCPGCRAWLKLPRGAGVVTVTCSRCQNNFTEKA